MVTTITVEDDTLERFKRLKAQATDEHIPEQSANDFLQSLMDTWEAVDDGMYQDETRKDIIKDIREQLNGLDGQQQTLNGKREIIGRIDDLETELTTRLERLQ
jgi:archaellum component FlaC